MLKKVAYVSVFVNNQDKRSTSQKKRQNDSLSRRCRCVRSTKNRRRVMAKELLFMEEQ